MASDGASVEEEILNVTATGRCCVCVHGVPVSKLIGLGTWIHIARTKVGAKFTLDSPDLEVTTKMFSLQRQQSFG